MSDDAVNARAAQIIADGFVNGIPYESKTEGTAVLRLYQFNTAALPPQLKNEVVASVRAIGEGLIQMLDKQGIILTGKEASDG